METRVREILDAWEPGIAPDERGDPLWQLHAYRVARCLIDLSRADAEQLVSRVDSKSISQLARSVASIGANLAEGYSRPSVADRSRFYGYALGSTREAVVWYQGLAWVLAPSRIEDRLVLLVQERRLLIGMLKSLQRSGGRPFEPG